MKQFFKVHPLLLVALFAATSLLSACAGATAQSVDQSYTLAPLDKMPAAVQDAPTTVQEAYQFAAANPDVTKQIPCYCGCGAMGHTSNYSCFVADDDAGGEIAFDEHALGCSICVDIAQDTMRLMDEGKSMDEIFTYVDDTYSRFGPPTSFSAQ